MYPAIGIDLQLDCVRAAQRRVRPFLTLRFGRSMYGTNLLPH